VTVPATRREPLFHIAEAPHWERAREQGTYERSTRGRSLAEVGFVHLATSAQWPGVLERFYADHDGPLVLLTVDPGRLTAPLCWEPPHPASDEVFPHLYGPLAVDAVVDERHLPRGAGWTPERSPTG
jgi:uncharacterized protein (DUF952 family)